jgi:hypothetical protein
MKNEAETANVRKLIAIHPSSSIPFELARLRTYPQHTLPLLPLLRSRPGGVHKASVVRSPKSDKDRWQLMRGQLSIADRRLSIR